MRVSERMIYDNVMRNAGAARSRVEDASNVASTGLRVSRASDDPAAAAELATRRQALSRADAIADATGRASDELDAADGALNTVTTSLARAREIAVQFSNATYSATDRAGVATEVDQLGQQIIAALNQQVGNRYIFGGSIDDKPPFDTSGNYLGDAQTRKVEIAPGVLQDASVRADVAIKGANGGVDVLSMLKSLSTALQTNDVAALQSSLDTIASATAQVSAARTQVGATQNTLSDAQAVAKSASTLEKTAISRAGDADSIDAASQLALAQRALQASLDSGAQTFQFSLLDILK